MSKIIRVYKRIFIHYSILFAAAATFFLGNKGNIGIILSTILVHELSHYIIALSVGEKINSVYISLIGVRMDSKNNYSPPNVLIAIAIAGPIGNILLGAIAYMLDYKLLFISNMAIALVNLLPAMPLDGGQVVYGFFSIYFGRKMAKKIVNITGKITGILIILLGIYVLYITRHNLTLLLVGIFILYSTKRNAHNPVLEVLGTRVATIKRANLYRVRWNVSALEVVSFIHANSVVAVENDEGLIIGFINSSTICHSLEKMGSDITISQCIKNYC